MLLGKRGVTLQTKTLVCLSSLPVIFSDLNDFISMAFLLLIPFHFDEQLKESPKMTKSPNRMQAHV